MGTLLEWFVSARNPFIYFSMLLSTPSMVLYIAEIVTIVRHKQFHNSFYTLFIVRAIPELLYVLASYYGYRLTIIFGSVLYPIYLLFPNWMIALSFFLTGYTFQAYNLATAFILLNRLTAIGMPLRHEKFWKKMLPLVILVVFGFPICTCWMMFKMEGALQFDGNSTSSFLLYEIEDGPYVKLLNSLDTAFAVIFMAVCSVINFGTFVAYKSHLRKSRQQMGTSTNNAACLDRIERKLLIYALATFFGHVLIACLLLSIYVATMAQDLLMLMSLYTHYPWVLDTGTVVISSWLLLWAGDSFRKQLLADFRVPRLRFESRSNRVGDGTGGTRTGNIGNRVGGQPVQHQLQHNNFLSTVSS